MPAATQTSRSERPAEYRIQNTEYRIRAAHTPPTAQFPESRIQHPLMCHLCSHAYASHAHVAGRIQNAEYRMRAGPSNMQFPRLLGDSVCCGRIQNARRTVQHAVSTPFGGFCMLRQNTECAPDRPTCSFHAFWGILYAAAEYRMRAGPSNMQFPRLLGDSVCCGRIQNAGRRMQGYWKTPTSAESKVFENTESRPAVSISPPATSPHPQSLSLMSVCRV
jgi:hypothetical protein